MNSSFEQVPVADGRPRSSGTRRRLLAAAAVLIAEVGWGRVTTRAIADRAGLPLGAVSYHFHGKRELLSQAAIDTVEGIFPMREFASLRSLAELLGLIKTSVGSRDSFDPVLSGVLMETMRESGRDPALRERMAALLADYRRVLTNLVRAEQDRGAVAADVDPAALATLLAAAGDGLVLHVLLDPDLDVAAAATALLAVLSHVDPKSPSGPEPEGRG